MRAAVRAIRAEAERVGRPPREAALRWVGRDRLCLLPASEGDHADLLEWISARSEVCEVRSLPGGQVVVCYREDRRSEGALRRGVHDRLAARARAGSQAREAPRFAVEIASVLPGRVRLRVTGLGDADLRRLGAWTGTLPGVRSAAVTEATGSILVELEAAHTDARRRRAEAERLREALAASDPARWPEAPPAPEREPGEGSQVPYTSALLAATATGFLPAPFAVAGIAVATVPCAKRAVAGLREGRLGVDLLDLASIVMSAATGLYTTAAFMTWLLAIGDHILARTSDRARAAISEVLALDAVEAWRVVGATTERVPVEALRPGDLIVIDAGARIAADGEVVEGLAMVDEKALTGEPLPAEKRPGARVLAATVVVEGQIIVRVERTGESTTAARIVRILEGTGAKPMTLQREIEKRADWLVLPTIGVASGAALLSGQIGRMTSCLITDFGTGVRIAIPTAVLATMALAAREGVLVKGGHYLERMSRADTVVFDKTGTLTSGAPRIVHVRSLGRLAEAELLALAAGAEARQKHPVAEAIRACAQARGVAPADVEVGSEVYTIGVGLAARIGGRAVLVGGARMMRAHGVELPSDPGLCAGAPPGTSTLYVAVDRRLEGVLGYADELRDESVEVVRALKAGGRRQIVLLSGDAPATVEAVAARLGIDRAMGGLLPEEKVQVVRELQGAGRTVAMVGDGINDAPALALAEVGISLDGATDVALEVADVVLLSGGLCTLPRAFEVADEAMARVRRGVTLVIAPNVGALVLGAAGLLSPGLAAVINNGSTVVAALAGVGPLLRARRKEKR